MKDKKINPQELKAALNGDIDPLVPQAAVRSLLVVVPTPGLDLPLGVRSSGRRPSKVSPNAAMRSLSSVAWRSSLQRETGQLELRRFAG